MEYDYSVLLSSLYEHILRDIAREYPEHTAKLDEYHTRLLRLLEHHGTSIFTIEFPRVGKHFDKCLSNGEWVQEKFFGMGIPKALRAQRATPELFGVLFDLVFESTGKLRQDADERAIFLLRQLLFAAKKLRMPCHDSRTFKTFQEFFDIDKTLRLPTLRWEEDSLTCSDWRCVSFTDLSHSQVGEVGGLFDTRDDESHAIGRHQQSCRLDVLQRVCDVVSTSFGFFMPEETLPKHGPGAVADLRVSKDHKNGFPNWPIKLQNQFPFDLFGLPNSSMVLDMEQEGFNYPSVHEPPSRLIAVPKTQKAPRLIAAEPTCHQWIQQGIKQWLGARWHVSPLRHCVDFNDQSLSRAGALEASMQGDRATVDLSAASDRLSCWTVERAFRSNPGLLLACHSSRTRWVANTIFRNLPSHAVIRKFACMGSALTFPVQSIVFSCAAIASVLIERRRNVTAKNVNWAAKQVRVYGDDIILPVDSLAVLMEILTDLQLKVNPDKTFGTGKFRESCGVDAYAGADVTPAYFLESYVEANPTTVATCVETSNNFFMKGLWATAKWIEQLLPQKIRKHLPVVAAGSGFFGLASFCGYYLNHLKRRWNSDYQREEVKVVEVYSRSQRLKSKGIWCLLQYFTERPSPTINWSSGVSTRAEPLTRVRWSPL